MASTLLYVEDNDDNIFVAEKRLKRAGYSVLIARDGEQGIALALANQPDLILMDLQMPVLDGWQASTRLKAMPATAHIPILALTASAMATDRDRALAAGCDDFDTKPIEMERLTGKIEALLKRRATPSAAATVSNAIDGSQTAVGAPSLAIDLSSCRLLVVDDNEDNRYTLVRRLQRLGYTQVDTADDGVQCLSAMQAKDYDLVLLDVMMPNMNGYQVLEQLAQHSKLRLIPVIMISALDQLDSVVRCIELGAEDYLAKPFEPVLLKARVGASLDKKRLRDALAAHTLRMERELAMAREIQLGMVPTSFPSSAQSGTVDLYAELHPAREVGGDLHDHFMVGEHYLYVAVADVADKGTPAALFMARTKSLLRLAATLLLDASVDKVLAVVNRELCRDNPLGMFVTVLLMRLDIRNGHLSFCNAGHLPPYRLSANGVQALVAPICKPVGVRTHVKYESAHASLRVSDVLVAFTDGVTEAFSPTGELYGHERIEQLLRDLKQRSVKTAVASVIASVAAHANGAAQSDDIAVLALSVEDFSNIERQTFVLPAVCSSVAQVAAYVDDLARAHAIPRDALADVQVVIDELLTNVASYAYMHSASTGSMTVAVDLRPGCLFLSVEDNGVAFNPLDCPRPDTTAALGERKVGGLGIEFVRRLMTTVNYERINELPAAVNRICVSRVWRIDELS